MNNRKKLPIGISEFRRLRENNYYYVDKTKMIEEILQTGAMVTLITRPRRFGKTLNMTMLREFFSMEVDSKEIFAGLTGETLLVGVAHNGKEVKIVSEVLLL